MTCTEALTTVNLGAEVRDPARTIPRSILLSSISVIVLFLMVHLAITGLVPWREAALEKDNLPVALAGGLFLNSDRFREHFLTSLRQFGIHPGRVTPVEEPATGAIVMARKILV